MKQIRFGYSTAPKAILVEGTETVQGLCATHNITIDSSVVNHNGMPLAPSFLSTPLSEINLEDGDSIIIVTKTNAA